MRDSHSRVDGARVLADLNALGGIGDYKTDVHKPIFLRGKAGDLSSSTTNQAQFDPQHESRQVTRTEKIVPNFPLLADCAIKQRRVGVYCE